MKTFKQLREESTALQPVKMMVVFSDGERKSYDVPKDTSFKDYVEKKIVPVEQGREVVHYGIDGKPPTTHTTVTSVKEAANKKKDPCWSGYEAFGTKEKNGKKVPNCIPVKEEALGEGFESNDPRGNKYHISVEHHASNRDVPLYTATYPVYGKDENSAIATVKKLFGGRNHRVQKDVAESIEQLDELSPSTLGSYIKKAKASAIGSSQVMGMGSNITGQKTQDKAEKTVQKRASGINTAVDRLTKESEDGLSEAWEATGKEGKHRETGEKTFEYKKVKTNKDGDVEETGERIWKNASGKMMGEGVESITEDEDKEYAKWQSDVKTQHKDKADKIRFISKPDAPHISAEVPGEDRSYGIWNHKEGKGQVLGEASTEKNYEYKNKTGKTANLASVTYSDGDVEHFVTMSGGRTSRHSTKEKAHASLRIRGFEPTGNVNESVEQTPIELAKAASAKAGKSGSRQNHNLAAQAHGAAAKYCEQKGDDEAAGFHRQRADFHTNNSLG